jgi:hypothetical protein
MKGPWPLLSDLLEHKSSVRAHDAGRCRLRFSFFSGYIDQGLPRSEGTEGAAWDAVRACSSGG